MSGSMETPDPEDVAAMDAWWRRDPGAATRAWEATLQARCAATVDVPKMEFRDDFAGHLYLVSSDPVAATWTVTVHPAPGAARVVQTEGAATVKWYDDPPPPAHSCWLIYDRACFIRIDAPAGSGPWWVRRSQPSFGRWRIRRRRVFG